jgi:hypothetical protein
MWITLFTIVIGIALCFGLGAMAVACNPMTKRLGPDGSLPARLCAEISAKVKCQD